VTSALVFGNLAIMAALAALDPLALRPQLSPGLPLSNEKIVNGPTSTLMVVNKTNLRRLRFAVIN